MVLSLSFLGQTPKSDIPPNIAPETVTPENHLQIWVCSVTLIGQLATVTIFGAILGGIPLSGAYPIPAPTLKHVNAYTTTNLAAQVGTPTILLLRYFEQSGTKQKHTKSR